MFPRKIVPSLVGLIGAAGSTSNLVVKQQISHVLRSSTFHASGNEAATTGKALSSWTRRNQTRRFHYQPTVSNVPNLKEKVHEPGSSNVVMTRLIEEFDTQMFGMAHGGLLMILMEEAGVTVTKQYLNDTTNHMPDNEAPDVQIILAGVEKVNFFKPMFRGEMAEVEANIVYSSEHSLRVHIQIFAKNLIKAKRRQIASGMYWFVPVVDCDDGQSLVLSVPEFKSDDSALRAQSEAAYLKMKQSREQVRSRILQGTVPQTPMKDPAIETVGAIANGAWSNGYEPGTVAHATSEFKIPLHPSHCWPGAPYIRGGISLAHMDELAAFSAITHIKHLAFTVSLENVIFHKKLHQGCVMVARSTPIFTSEHTMEMQTTVYEQRLEHGVGMFREKCVEGIYKFLSIDETGKPRKVEPLKIKTEEELRLFEERKRCYEESKREGK